MNDPLQNKAFQPPGLLEKFAQTFLGAQRPFDSLQIEITSHCIGSCNYCPHGQDGWEQTHMQPETFSRLWPVLRSARRAHLQGWGEPLLNPHFFEFQQFAQKAGCLTSTTTCGFNITPELAVKLARSGMDIIAVSLAGTDKAANSCRKNVPFERVCESLCNLRSAIDAEKSSMELHIAYLLLADRMESVAGLPELMEKYDADAAVVSTLDYIATPDQKELAITAQDSARLNRARELLEQASARATAMGKIIYFDLPGEPDSDNVICHENPQHCFYINADGFVSPCIYLNVQGNQEDRQVFGNVLDTEPVKIWKSLEYQTFRNQLDWGKPSGLCRRCPKRYA